MKLRLRIEAEGTWWSGVAIKEIPELLHEVFEPLRICDDRQLAKILGEFDPHSAKVQKVLKVRADAAAILAKEISDFILKEMSKHDTRNGYKVNET